MDGVTLVADAADGEFATDVDVVTVPSENEKKTSRYRWL